MPRPEYALVGDPGNLRCLLISSTIFLPWLFFLRPSGDRVVPLIRYSSFDAYQIRPLSLPGSSHLCL